jgi:hypothetical protein
MSLVSRVLTALEMRSAEKARAAALDASAKAPTTALGKFNRASALKHGWTLELLAATFHGAPVTWDDVSGFELVQQQLLVREDGWFGEDSYRALMRGRFSDRPIVAGRPLPPPPGVKWVNWYAPENRVARLPTRDRRGRTPNQSLIHESVTGSQRATERVLANRGLSVHTMMVPCSEWGVGVPVITQHADLAWDRCTHAAGQNGPSVAAEIVNPYYPETRPQSGPWTDVIEGCRWADDGRDKRQNYVVPTHDQLEGLVAFLDWLRHPVARMALNIPLDWPGLEAGRLALSRAPKANVRAPGIWHHAATAHADGGFPRLYAYLRLVAQLEPDHALKTAKELATTGERFAVISGL